MGALDVTRVELTAFEVRIADVGADPVGFGVWYEPGAGSAQSRLAVRIHTRDGPVGEYVAPRARVEARRADRRGEGPSGATEPARAASHGTK